MTIICQMALAELTAFQDSADKAASPGGQVVWLVAILLLVAMLLVTVKKSKRTHLT